MNFVKAVFLKGVGEIWYSVEDGFYNVYTRAIGYGDFVFQFGVKSSDDEIVDLILSNLEDENIYFEVE